MGRPRAAGNDLPKYLHMRRGVYYFVTPITNEWVHLGHDRTKAEAQLQTLLGRINAAKKVLPAKDVMNVANVPADTLRELGVYTRFVTGMYTSARSGARARKLPFEITKQDILDLMTRSGGKCSVTGIPFSTDRVGKRGRMPWWPSLDRRDSAKGYTPDNIRIVCHAVNTALWDFGDEVLLRIAHGVVSNCPISSVLTAKTDPADYINQ